MYDPIAAAWQAKDIPALQNAINSAGLTAGSAMDRYGLSAPDLGYIQQNMGLKFSNGAPARAPMQPQPQQSSWGGNPYLSEMYGMLDKQADQTYARRQQMNRSNAIGVGGLGGSRQGVADALAGEFIDNGLMDAKAKLAYGDFDATQNRALQSRALDQQYDLGWGGLNNQRLGINNSFTLGMGGLANQYDANRNSFNLGSRAMDDQDRRTGMAMWGLGDQAQWDPLKNASGIYGNFSGYGNNTTSSSSGGGLMGAIGGGLGAAQLGKNFGWWNNTDRG